MTKIGPFVLVLLIATISFGQTPESESFIGINGFYGFGFSSNIFAGQIGIELKPSFQESISYSFEYSYTKTKGGATFNNPGSSNTYNFIVYYHTWYLNAYWHPVRTIKQPFSWLFLGLGVGYFQQYYNAEPGTYGPSVQGTFGVQYVLRKNIVFSIKSQYHYIYNLNMSDPARIKFTGMPIRIGIGYRF